jgi:hypothetical protein
LFLLLYFTKLLEEVHNDRNPSQIDTHLTGEIKDSTEMFDILAGVEAGIPRRTLRT